ncbi:hypothetical protein R3P38DRAFT_1632903, partial [Favolaschia claudopus]
WFSPLSCAVFKRRSCRRRPASPVTPQYQSIDSPARRPSRCQLDSLQAAPSSRRADLATALYTLRKRLVLLVDSTRCCQLNATQDESRTPPYCQSVSAASARRCSIFADTVFSSILLRLPLGFSMPPASRDAFLAANHTHFNASRPHLSPRLYRRRRNHILYPVLRLVMPVLLQCTHSSRSPKLILNVGSPRVSHSRPRPSIHIHLR